MDSAASKPHNLKGINFRRFFPTNIGILKIRHLMVKKALTIHRNPSFLMDLIGNYFLLNTRWVFTFGIAYNVSDVGKMKLP